MERCLPASRYRSPCGSERTISTRDEIESAALCLRQGGILAYPTEACYGLGCDPRNHNAIKRILKLKQRPWQKGLILLASDIDQLTGFIDTNNIDMKPVLASWPGPTTWVLPAAGNTSHWLRGEHDSIAVRVTDHRLARHLCRQFHGAIVSTSANRNTRSPALSADQVRREFGQREIDYILEGKLGGLGAPTRIIDAQTGTVYRDGSPPTA